MNPVNKQISDFEKVIISDEKDAAAVIKAISIVLPKVSAYMSKMTMSIISRDNKIGSLERKLANVGQFVPEVTVDEVTQTINEEVTEEKKIDRIAQMKAAEEETVVVDPVEETEEAVEKAKPAKKSKKVKPLTEISI